MAHVVNKVEGEDIVAFVRTTEGGTVKLYSGDTAPAEADLNHVAQLVEQGVLSGDGAKPSGAEAILATVGSDVEKAQAYLDEERAASRPRKTLVEALEAVIAHGAAD